MIRQFHLIWWTILLQTRKWWMGFLDTFQRCWWLIPWILFECPWWQELLRSPHGLCSLVLSAQIFIVLDQSNQVCCNKPQEHNRHHEELGDLTLGLFWRVQQLAWNSSLPCELKLFQALKWCLLSQCWERWWTPSQLVSEQLLGHCSPLQHNLLFLQSWSHWLADFQLRSNNSSLAQCC